MKIPAFYINLDSDASRRQRIERELERAGLKAERLAGVNGVDVPPQLERFFFENGAPASNLTPGEVGCYASHLKAMQLVLHRGLDWALILEDDARLHTRLAEIIESAIERVPAGWDFIKLCRYPRAVRPLRKLAAGRMLVRYKKIPEGTAGYLVSRSGARKMLARQPKICPVDVDMQSAWFDGLEVFGVTPPATPEEIALASASSIGQRGGASRAERAFKLAGKRKEFYYNARRLGFLWWGRHAIAKITEGLAHPFAKRRISPADRIGSLTRDAERALAWCRDTND